MEASIAHPRFLQRVFSEHERQYILEKNRVGAQSAAGFFAAKEALLKALGTGIVQTDLSVIEVRHDEAGAPYYQMNEEIERLLYAKGASRAHLSISHDEDYAVAFCVLEG